MRNLALTSDQELHFQAWRATALQIMPYMASVMFALRPVNSTGVDTFGVDPGLRLYINFENTVHRGPRFNAEALLHECSHVLAEHEMLAKVAGVTDEERDTWNIAGDMAINDDLRDAGCKELAAHGVFAAKINEPDYQTPLHYMNVLRKKQQQQQKKQQQQGGGQGQPQPSQGGGPGQNKPQDGNGQPIKGCGSGAGGKKGSHELGDDDMNGKAPAADAVQKELVRISTASAIRQHAEQNGIGSVPGSFIEMADMIMTPTATPWQRVLASFMRRAVASKSGAYDTDRARRHRRRIRETMKDGEGRVLGRVIVPGLITPIPSVHFYRDTSGSMSTEQLELVSREVETIARKIGIRGKELMISDVDRIVHASRAYQGKSTMEEIHGRGGTDMGEAIRHACELRRKPTCIVVATDGETGWPSERPAVPVVVVLVNVTDPYWKENVPSWAHVVEVKNDA